MEKRYCNKCGNVVLEEQEIEEYPYYCEYCEENMYNFEVHTIK